VQVFRGFLWLWLVLPQDFEASEEKENQARNQVRALFWPTFLVHL
jgi:hypothetical protein